MLYRKLMGFVLFQLVISSINAQVDYNYIPYRKGSKWGFCDSTKRVIIEPVFDRVSHFTTYKQYQPALKLAKVNMASGQGLLDTTGQLLISCNYTSFNFSSDYILLYNDTAQFMYTIADGSIKKVGTLGDVMPLEEVEIFATHNKIERIGRKEIKITRYSPDFSGEKERYITSSIILKADTAIFSYSTDTIFRVGRNNKWGYASFSEGIFLDPVYDTAIELNKGKAYAFKKGEDWYGHKRNSGKANPYWLGNSHLKMISGSYQYFTTLRGGKYGVLNTEFETTIPFTFDSLLCLSSNYGRFAGMTNDNWQIFDFESLKPVDTITFDAIEMDKLKGAHFVVKSNGTWYLHINNRGKDLFVYPHSKPYYGYFYVGIPGRLEVFGKNSEFLGYANFKGLNYWDE